jgi:hypothetical protein
MIHSIKISYCKLIVKHITKMKKNSFILIIKNVFLCADPDLIISTVEKVMLINGSTHIKEEIGILVFYSLSGLSSVIVYINSQNKKTELINWIGNLLY